MSLKAKGSFTQNLAITFSGTVAAQAIGFFFTPFIARIYGPQAYGLFALFISITGILSPMVTLQYPAAFVTARNERDFRNLVQLSLLTVFFFTIAVLIFLWLFRNRVLIFFNATELNNYIFLIPVYIFFMGIENILLGWSIKRKEFKLSAAGKILSVITSKALTVVWGLQIAATSLGMIVGNLLTYPVDSLLKLSKGIQKEFKQILRNNSVSTRWSTFKNYKAYPLYVTAGLLFSNFSNQLPVYYFSVVFNQSLVGYYALASSLVTIPVSLIISSSTTVFLQKAAEVFQNDPGQLKHLVLRLYKRLFIMGFLPLLGIAVFGDYIFLFLFGNDWKEAGLFASVLAFGVIFSVPASPLTVVFRVTRKEQLNFIINLIFIAIRLTGLLWGTFTENIQHSIIGLSLASIAWQATQLFWIFHIVALDKKRIVRDILIVGFLFYILMLVKL
ncbi:MAG: oligosaccharide flippase family protein [Cyclobacteriaceae bacterium]|nr:oligosaccharide flippase family protein [Cyclobacteriaceae bacterium]